MGLEDVASDLLVFQCSVFTLGTKSASNSVAYIYCSKFNQNCDNM